MRSATPSPIRSVSRTRHLSRPMTQTCQCSSPADHPSILVRRVLTVALSRGNQLQGPQLSTPGSVSFPHELGDLSLEAGHSPLELVHAVAERGDLALDELPRSVAYPLIDLGRSLLERLACESIVEHIRSSRIGRMDRRSIAAHAVHLIVAWNGKRAPTRDAVRLANCADWRLAT